MNLKKLSLRALFFAGMMVLVLQGILFSGFKPKEKFIGLQLYSVRDDMKKDVKGTVAKVGEMGFKFVEAAGYSDGKFYGMDPIAFRNLCERNGLKFMGSHSGKDMPDDAHWDEVMAWWDTCIDAHAAGGVTWIVQPWMSKEGYNSLEGLKRYVKYFNAVGEKCRAKGIRFGYHNHAKEFTTVFDGKPLYDWMLELTDPNNVMFQLDLYWIVEGGKNPVDYFNKYPGRFFLWHIKDEKELGAGTMDFKTIFASKKKSGMKFGIVEVERYDYAPLESCERSLKYMNSDKAFKF